MSRWPLRIRVALAFAAASALTLVGLGVFVYLRVEATLNQQTRTTLSTRMDALAQTPPSARRVTVAEMTGEAFGQVVASDGALIVSSPQISQEPLTPDLMPEPGQRMVYDGRVTFVDEGERENATLLTQREGSEVIVVGTSRESVEDALAQVRTQLTVAVPVALGIAVIVGYWVAGRALEPVRRMTRRAGTISAENSTDRLPIPDARDEIHDLGRTLNAMLDRLDAALQRERRFIAEASHDLRTPLALLRMELDLALSGDRSSSELSEALHSTSEEVDRLTQLAETLLDFSASAEDGVSVVDAVDVQSLLRQVKGQFDGEANARGREILVPNDDPVVCCGNRDALLRALGNLVDNALRHGAGRVVLGATQDGGAVTITVSDSGLGSAADVAGQEFDPLARSGPARAEATRGLGLAIVKTIVERHGGRVALTHESTPPSTTATVVLPADGAG